MTIYIHTNTTIGTLAAEFTCECESQTIVILMVMSFNGAYLLASNNVTHLPFLYKCEQTRTDPATISREEKATFLISRNKNKLRCIYLNVRTIRTQ